MCNPLSISHWLRSEGSCQLKIILHKRGSWELLLAALTAAGGRVCQAAEWGLTVSTTSSFWPWLPDKERPTPQRPGSTQKPQPPQKRLSHSVSFVKLNKVIFEETGLPGQPGKEAGSGSGRPKPWGQPLKGSHSVVMSQDWHPSSYRVAEPGFTGK